MRFLLKVRVDLTTMSEFGQKLLNNELDRTMIVSETYCLADDPAVGYSIWAADSREAFDKVFVEWEKYYSEVKINVVVSPNEAMQMLMNK